MNLMEGDNFIILASDGVWEFISNEEVAAIIMPHFKKLLSPEELLPTPQSVKSATQSLLWMRVELPVNSDSYLSPSLLMRFPSWSSTTKHICETRCLNVNGL